MNKNILSFMITSFLLMSLVSASPLSDFMSNDVSTMIININQNQSNINFNIDTSGYAWDFQNISIPEQGISFENVQLSSVLNSVNFNLIFNNETRVPVFYFVNIVQGTFLQGMLDFLFSYLHLGFTTSQINSNVGLLNILLENYSSYNTYNIPASFEFSKLGNAYAITMDKGYGEVPTAYLDNIRSIIEFGVYSLNTKSLVETYVLPELSSYNVSLLENLDYDVDVGLINLSSVKLEDGTYYVDVQVSNNGEIVTKRIRLVLFGIVNSGTGTADNYTYTPTQNWIKEYVLAIENLEGNSTFIFDIFDNMAGLSSPSGISSLKYMNITSSLPTSATINFRVLKSKVNNTGLVSLYVLEGTTWTKLTTRYLGDDGTYYNYEADTPHFSLFMIGQTAPAITTTTTPATEENHDTSSIDRCEVGETKCIAKDEWVCYNYGYSWKVKTKGGCVEEELAEQVITPQNNTIVIEPKETTKKNSNVGMIIFLVVVVGLIIVGVVWFTSNKSKEE